ncbi:hypothetical protein MLD38_019737 [Melastoma candidum]|uniref:Uncharacterized protein n=1 Tax=Melastoma candidum TaxID=119954 RepID=A0ACB9R1H1_9MYRT|nr:hypothetical protein MLD38_019737 [Melastoma candidum]
MSDPASANPTPYISPPVTIVIAVVLLVFFFVGLLSIYFCRCFFESFVTSWSFRGNPISLMGPRTGRAGGPGNGLDDSVIHCFPTFDYSSVKGFRREKYGLECAICLVEFEDDSLLRLITVCYHVFHQECIDLWLSTQKTCPVCRANLDLPLQKLLERSPDILVPDHDDEEVEGVRENNGVVENVITIDRDVGSERCRGTSGGLADTPGSDTEKLPRSHSTGHSLLNGREEEYKYMLRLSRQVKVRITRGKTGSAASFEDFSTPKGSQSLMLGELPESSKGNIDNV